MHLPCETNCTSDLKLSVATQDFRMSAPYYGLSPFQLPEAASSSREVVLAARDSMIAQRDALERQVLSANALLNSTTPVNRLPQELLINIFRVLKEQSPETSAHPWYKIAAVCRSWRAIACSAPLLWADIHVSPRMNAVLFQAFLERSHPIAISVLFVSTVRLAPYLALIRAHLPRVRVLRFLATPRSEADLVADLLEESMPALEQLSVMLNPSFNEDTDTDDEDEDVLSEPEEEEVFLWNPMEEKLPNLRLLCLRGVALGFSSTIGASLEGLELRDCVGGDASLLAVNNVLRRCVNLKTLAISRYRCNEEHVGPGPRITLPKTLRTFDLEDTSWSTAYVLDTLYVPPTTNVYINKLVADEPEDGTDAPISSCIPDDKSCLPILAMVDHVHVVQRRDDGSCAIIGRRGPRKITVEAIPSGVYPVVPDIAHDLAALFANAPLVDLVVTSLGIREITATGWVHILGRFPLLRRVAVIGLGPDRTSQSRDTLLEALQGGRGVLCPNLRELAISSYDEQADGEVLESIKDCLERRAARGQRLATLRLCLTSGAPYHLKAMVDAARCRREEWWSKAASHLADAVVFEFDTAFDEEVRASSVLMRNQAVALTRVHAL